MEYDATVIKKNVVLESPWNHEDDKIRGALKCAKHVPETLLCL